MKKFTQKLVVAFTAILSSTGQTRAAFATYNPLRLAAFNEHLAAKGAGSASGPVYRPVI